MVKKLKTNEDLVHDLMTRSPHGALGQVFIVEAIRRYADALVATPLSPDQLNGFVYPAKWNAVAADVKRRCDAFYDQPRAEG